MRTFFGLHWMAGMAIVGGSATIARPAVAAAPAPGMAPYDVVWTEPGRGAQDSMPLGNGDIGLNVWTDPNGDLCFYVAKTDAWSENGNLHKLGRVRVRFTPALAREAVPFEQRLSLQEGAVVIRSGPDASRLEVRVWVDASRPVIHVEGQGAVPFTVRAEPELWRKSDVLVREPDGRLAWYHRNATSDFAARLKAHGLEGLETSYPDPLLHRTFGCLLGGDGLGATADGSAAVCTNAPCQVGDLQIHVLTAQTATADEWLQGVRALARESSTATPDSQRRQHQEWWQAFWQRSWIVVDSGTAVSDRAAATVSPTGLPLRLGADDQGQNTFRGLLGRARVFTRPLDAAEIAQLAASMDASPVSTNGLAGDWRLDGLRDGTVPDTSGAGRTTRPNGPVEFASLQDIRGAKLTGTQWFDVPNDETLDRVTSLTLDAWIAPEQLPGGGARILNKSKAGTAEGYLLDTFPGNSLRMIIKAGTVGCAANLPPGAWSHVAAVFDATTGEQTLYVNGKQTGKTIHPVMERLPEGFAVSRGYALQRFIAACAGRGVYPIKFNGSLFCVDWPEKDSLGNPDARRWGPDYWWQNTRLPYWAMLAAGDYEMMQPLYRMYLASMPLQKERTRRYFGHNGAYYPETMNFWGLSRDGDYGTGKTREGQPLSWHVNQYVRRLWEGGIELTLMMLDQYAHTGDAEFARRTLVPFASEILTFYDEHYPRDASGRIRFEPAQALETWWECVDPMPEVAGLVFVLPRLLALPGDSVPAADRQRWERMLKALPPIPILDKDGRRLLAPARQFAENRNCENPELYAVFPYRLYGVGKPDLDLARATMTARRNKMFQGWTQDEIQLACLGMTDEARKGVVQRASSKYPHARFPAFWGPNFDWIPDQDHGSNLLTALQTMLMQCDGDTILLFPAWPREWNVEFKLHAPHATTVQGVYRDGKLVELNVEPASRRGDVKVLF